MDSSTKKHNNDSLMKTHFLKPYVTAVDGGVAELPRQRFSVSSSNIEDAFSRISFSGFWSADGSFKTWVMKMQALHEPIWRKAGIFEAIKASTYKIRKDQSLVLPLVEKWCHGTKSFVFPWGEATITLEDVMVLLGFSVLGSPAFAPLESSEMRDSLEKLQKETREIRIKNKDLRQGSWISSFLGRGDQMEHEAFLVLWLSFFVFPGKARPGISKHVFPIAVRLARGERISLAPAVLAILYRDLDRIHDLAREKCDEKVHLKSLFKLVQIWTWERFKNTSPTPIEIPKGEPRISRWNSLQKRDKKNVTWSFDDFDWRPYTTPLKNWNPLLFYLEEAIWVTVDDESIDHEFASFARCVSVSQLVGDGFVEGYFPNRVARQFGLDQDLPGLVTRYRNFTEKEAWDDYNKSLDGVNLYMPSRLDRGSVTARYQDWWLKSVSKFLCSEEMPKEPTETYNARNRFDHYDDDDDGDDGDIDASPKVLPLSHVVQKLEEGFPAKCRRSRMSRLVNRDKVGELVNSLLSSGWKMNKTSKDWTNKKSNYKSVQMKRTHEDDDESSINEEDDSMTIAQRTRSRKKYSAADKSGGDGFETLRKRTRRYVAADSDDSEPCQEVASIKIEQRSEEDDETASKVQKTRRICDDFEVDLTWNTAEKRTMIDDEPCNGPIMQSIGRNETKKAECLVHEDGEKQRYNEKLCSEVKKEEEIDERLKQRKLAIKEIELKLEARIVEVEKTLAKIRNWKTRRNQTKSGVSA